MKLFYIKEYKKVSGDLEKTKIELNRAYFKIERYRENISRLEKEKISLNASKGGLTKEINKLKCDLVEKDNLIDEKQIMINEKDSTIHQLKKEINELNNLINDLKSDRYLIKKIKPGRTPNLNKTKISMPMKPNVAKFMKENFD